MENSSIEQWNDLPKVLYTQSIKDNQGLNTGLLWYSVLCKIPSPLLVLFYTLLDLHQRREFASVCNSPARGGTWEHAALLTARWIKWINPGLERELNRRWWHWLRQLDFYSAEQICLLPKARNPLGYRTITWPGYSAVWLSPHNGQHPHSRARKQLVLMQVLREAGGCVMSFLFTVCTIDYSSWWKNRLVIWSEPLLPPPPPTFKITATLIMTKISWEDLQVFPSEILSNGQGWVLCHFGLLSVCKGDLKQIFMKAFHWLFLTSGKLSLVFSVCCQPPLEDRKIWI